MSYDYTICDDCHIPYSIKDLMMLEDSVIKRSDGREDTRYKYICKKCYSEIENRND